MSNTVLYLDVVRPLNAGYGDLLDALCRMDTRAFYIRNFASVLSPALRGDLWSNEQYVSQLKENPLPTDLYAKLEYDTFQSWITVYEMIMRQSGLIGSSGGYDASYISKYFGSGGEDDEV
ncbi:MAG TPA: hypothetical protein VJY42_02250 [Candidatus Methanomethylophilaceae archaeon]|nr:hypothetical protein [Candidatus Methanomethylophilaceae archaeon]